MATAKKTTQRQRARVEEAPKKPAKAAVDPRQGGTPDIAALAQHGLAPKGPDSEGTTALRQRTKRADEKVSVTVPQGYTLTISHAETVRYEPGVQDMLRSHAEHQYSVANGVEINE